LIVRLFFDSLINIFLEEYCVVANPNEVIEDELAVILALSIETAEREAAERALQRDPATAESRPDSIENDEDLQLALALSRSSLQDGEREHPAEDPDLQEDQDFQAALEESALDAAM
jgi:hypothetical protein